ncbi:MAG: PAS domain-containing protein [Bdellovibrionales bacterium]|nr:PAS domain-containing protein [Bdellovibrionales bacterium]
METSSHFQPDEIDGVLAAAQVGIWVWEVSTGLSVWNAAMFEIFEIPQQQFDGSYDCWKHRIHSEDLGLLQSVAQTCLETPRLLKMKYRVVTSQGNIKIIKNRVRGIADSSGKLVKIVGVNIDVTEAVRAQEDLAINERTLFQARQMTQMALWEEDLVTGELSLSTELPNFRDLYQVIS